MSANLKQLKTDIESKVKDLATLEVASFCGTVTFQAGTSTEDIFQTIYNGLPTSELVGYSKFELDGDSVNFINSELGEGNKYLIDGHNALVEGAQKTRKDLFDFVLKVVRNIKG